jgi:divalent metal cation (Fe/Co/Zn/Cd) transporter
MGALGVSALLVATGVGIGMHSLETLRAVTAAELVLEPGLMWVAVGAAAVSLVAKEVSGAAPHGSWWHPTGRVDTTRHPSRGKG